MLCINSTFCQEMKINLGVHNHHVANGKCMESLKETRRLIAKEVDCMLDTKMSMISLSANKTFLTKHLFDDCNNGKMQLLKGE